MFIDTRSKESMESSMSTYLDIPVDELHQYIDYAAEKAQKDQWAFNIDLFYEELGNIISDLQPKIAQSSLSEKDINEIDEYELYVEVIDRSNSTCTLETTLGIQVKLKAVYSKSNKRISSVEVDDINDYNCPYCPY